MLDRRLRSRRHELTFRTREESEVSGERAVRGVLLLAPVTL